MSLSGKRLKESTIFFFLFKLLVSPSTVSYLQLVVLQTLDIVAENPEKFRVVALAAGSNVTLLADQVNIYMILYSVELVVSAL